MKKKKPKPNSYWNFTGLKHGAADTYTVQWHLIHHINCIACQISQTFQRARPILETLMPDFKTEGQKNREEGNLKPFWISLFNL